MNLIHLYINEVTRRLPAEDIALELRSNIEDMLPEDYSEEDVKKVLQPLYFRQIFLKCISPALLSYLQ
ncbi:hypothetical protein [Peribacillus frigoritolerans]|uniref:hypothetical protein n=1 Tax=Peribacillus frigoritolerans TaxID=450367 RepID=UPI001059D4E1|nr:hypothetical protein [Peribacillus frigoritolerans]TDL75899.1 hypothetical protein E2R53_21325 [Peribacillus frigoritolerans]